MHKRHDIIIILLTIIIILLVTMMLTGCASRKGLHYPNGTRNATAKWQQHNEHGRVARYINN